MKRPAVAVAMLLVTAIAHGQGRSTVPADLVSIANRAPLEVVLTLASQSVPAGIEVFEADDRYPRRPPDFRPASSRQVPLNDVVTAFNDSHPAYRATNVDGVFVVRPASGRVSFLDGQSTIPPATAVLGAMQAMKRILSPLDPQLLEPSVGSSLGRQAAKAFTAEVTLDGSGGRTVLQTLNQVVLQVPGAWQVTTRMEERQTEIVRLAFIYTDFSRTVSTVSD